MEPLAWKNLKIYTMDQNDTVYENGGILIEDGKISAVGASGDIEAKASGLGITCIDQGGKALFPGFINTHTHLYQELLKGRGADMCLEDWWPTAMAPAGLKLRERHVCAGTLVGIAEALQSGVTTIADYMQLQPVEGLGSAQLNTVKQTGIRMVYGRGYRDAGKEIGAPTGLFEDLDKVFLDVDRLKKEFDEEDLFSIWLAPAAVWGLTFEGMKKTVTYSKATKTPIMMHMFETDTDNVMCQKRYGMQAAEYFEKSGLFGADLLAVHSVAVDDDIIKKYQEYGVKVSYNPVANMYLASGAAPIHKMLKHQILVGIGTDGAGSNNDNDLISAMKIGALLQKTADHDPMAITARQIIRMATIEGAKALNLDKKTGSIEDGKDADLFIFDAKRSPKTYPFTDEVTSLVYSGDCKAIDLVMVKGRVLYQNGEYLTMDYERIIWDAGKMALEL